MNEPSLIGKRLKKYRKRAQMTQHQLAEATGISQSLIGTVESGYRHGFSVRNLNKLADALGVTLDQLARPKREKG